MFVRAITLCIISATLLLSPALGSPAPESGAPRLLAKGSLPSSVSPVSKNANDPYKLGNESIIVCQLNKDRKNRYELPVFAHQTLSQAAEILGTRYAGGTFNNSLFDDVYTNLLQPLGNSVTASYKILGTFSSDIDYTQAVERSIYSTLLARNLQAIGVYERRGVYTIVTAAGLADLPGSIDPCPVSPSPPYSPPGTDPSRTVDGIDLPSFLCAINGRRTDIGTVPFVMHKALESEASEQAKQMVRLGRYTVDGPRKVDQALYSAGAALKKLYWFAGDRYTGARALVDLLMASYADTLLDPNYSVVGVAQEEGYWSVILAQLYRNPAVKFTCPVPDSGGVDSVRSYTFDLPSTLPGTDHSVFAWSWVNASGNRELYMNCGDIAVVGSAGSYSGKEMTIANYGPGYPVIAEFRDNYDTSIDYYTTNTTKITVTGSGYTGSSDVASDSPSSSATSY
ncbi:hypothetical protein EV175_001430 [Coemansia sp. RSA 1933]|nr:hypothetical protein EV175_001430 [Coemansia sp. RSA 1933]